MAAVTAPTTDAFARAAAVAALWPDTEQWLPAAALPALAGAAEEADRSGRLATASLERLRAEGFVGMPVPRELGGGGAGLLASAAAQRCLATTDPALAIALNMHLFSVGTAVEHWRRHRDACGLLLEAIATQGRVVASAFAEPGLAGTILRSRCRAVATSGGHLVSGVKTPCSLAAHCDLVCLQIEAAPPAPPTLMTAVIPASADGVRVERTWDALGMRGSGSDTLVLDGCFVPDELVFHRCAPGSVPDEVLAAGLVWFCVTTTATYLGVVHAALDAAGTALRRSPVSYLDCVRADLATVQAQLGNAVAAPLALEAGCVGVASRLDSGTCDARSLLPIAVALKQAAVDACTDAVETWAELVGGASYAAPSALARLWRDVQALRFHPPTRPASSAILGRWALDQPFALEPDGPRGT